MGTRRMSRFTAVVAVGATVAVLSACQGDAPEPSGAGTPPSAAAPTNDPTAGPTEMPGAVTAPFEAGYQPPWFEGTRWSCGMPADDLVTVAGDYTLAVEGDVTDVAGGEPSHSSDRFLPVTLTGPEGAVHISPPATVWTQGGVVVELPALADAGPVETAGGARLAAVLGLVSHCVPGEEADGMATYATELPEGAYQVRAFVETQPGEDPRQLVLSDPVDVAVTADGIVQR